MIKIDTFININNRKYLKKRKYSGMSIITDMPGSFFCKYEKFEIKLALKNFIVYYDSICFMVDEK